MKTASIEVGAEYGIRIFDRHYRRVHVLSVEPGRKVPGRYRGSEKRTQKTIQVVQTADDGSTINDPYWVRPQDIAKSWAEAADEMFRALRSRERKRLERSALEGKREPLAAAFESVGITLRAYSVTIGRGGCLDVQLTAEQADELMDLFARVARSG